MPISASATNYEDDFGYCTVKAVANVLGEPFPVEGSDPSAAHIADAIRGQGAWLRRATKRHFYDPTYDPSNTSDGNVDLPTEPRPVTEQGYDIPSSPHPQHTQLATQQPRRYPRQHRGTYTRVQLDHRYVQSVDALRVRSRSEYEDWVQQSDKSEGRMGEYYVSTDEQTGRSELLVDTRAMTPLADYGEALVVDYSYGLDVIPESIGRAVAFKAASELALDKDSHIQIPDSGAVDVQTASQEFDKKADKLLKPYRATPVA